MAVRSPKPTSLEMAHKWLRLECVPAVLLILLVWPLTALGGPYSMKAILVFGASTLATGDLAAAGVCFLLPMMTLDLSGAITDQDRMKMNVLSGIVIAGGFYWLTKFKPASVLLEGTNPNEAVGRALLYSVVSISIAFYTLATAYRVKVSCKP
jgi:peptidoglycan biosynthesis protein MviN/MurJ (putative lipid II flippase)